MNADLEPREPLGPTDAQITRMRANVHRTITADQSATRRRRGWTIGGTLGLLVILAGGTSIAMAAGVLQAPSWFTAAPAAAPTVTHDPMTVTATTPTVTPTPSATPTQSPAPQAAAPSSRIALPCSDITPGAAMGSSRTLTFDDDYVEKAGTVDAAPMGVARHFALLQSGALFCEWGTWPTAHPADVDPGIEKTTVVEAVPDAASGFHAAFGEAGGPILSCEQGECEADTLVGDTWLHIEFWSGLDEGSARTALSSYLATVAAKVAALPVDPTPWRAPQSTIAVPSSCDELASASEVQTVIGAMVTGTPMAASPIDRFADAAAGALTCDWNSQGYDVSAAVLPGGAWAWTPTGPPVAAGEVVTPIRGLGDGAYLVTSPSGDAPEPTIEARVGGAWVIVLGSGTPDALTTFTRTLIAGLQG